MKKLNIATFLFLLWMLLVVSCSPSSDYSPQDIPKARGTLEGLKAKPISSEQNAFAFASFLQKIGTQSTAIDSLQLIKEAALFFPDSTFHAGLNLYGLEIPYCDSIRLLYYEFSNSSHPESFAYLGAFTQEGQVLDILPIKEATYNGNAAVNLIDRQIVEMEYYDVYDAEGYQQDALVFDYYQLDDQGKWQLLSRTEQVSAGRKYGEASLRLLSKEELNRYTPKELTLMQQEVLAEYGQQFDTPQWQEYFDQQDWYSARYKTVDHLLSDLERVNLKKIDALLGTY